jgi:hypothetical protein
VAERRIERERCGKKFTVEKGAVDLKKEGGAAAHWPWPNDLNALTAAPEHHRLLFENERVRVLEVRIGPGELTPVHTHRWPSVVHVAKSSNFLRRDGEGKLLFDSRTMGLQPATPVTQWIEGLPPHSVENIGNTEILLISTELKEER